MPIDKSPATNYLSRTNILFPGTQAQADALEAVARVEIAALVPANGGSAPALTNGQITPAPA